MWTTKLDSRLQRLGPHLTFGLAVLATGLALRPAAVATDGALPPRWTRQQSGVTARLRGVSAVSERVAWASGAAGTVLRTVDGGRTWESRSVPGAESLDFRDVDALDDHLAYALSIGPGEASRIYRTADGGLTWDLQFINREPAAFFDAMAFWDADRGLAVSDSVGGRFVVLRTVDGGRKWKPVPAGGLPPALPGEAAFAASGTSVAVYGTRHAWIGTGGAAGAARVLRSQDGGETWAATTTPLPSGPSAGIFSVAFRDAEHGIVVGGDHRKEAQTVRNAAVTRDGGATWTAVPPPGLSGFRSAVAYAGSAGRRILAVGPTGADDSADDGRGWRAQPGEGFHALSFAAGASIGWAVGEGGRIALVQVAPDATARRDERPGASRDAARRLPFSRPDRGAESRGSHE